MGKVKKMDDPNKGKEDVEMKECPLIRKSYKECYCMDMNSMKIYDAIYYCGNHYKLCPIYREKTAAPGERLKLANLFKKIGQK